MRSENYRNYFKSSYMMGPNCLRLLDEILGEYPLHYTSDNLVLDLGCGPVLCGTRVNRSGSFRKWI